MGWGVHSFSPLQAWSTAVRGQVLLQVALSLLKQIWGFCITRALDSSFYSSRSHILVGWKKTDQICHDFTLLLSRSGDEPPSKIIYSLKGPSDLALELHFISISFASMSELEIANLDMTAEEKESRLGNTNDYSSLWGSGPYLREETNEFWLE